MKFNAAAIHCPGKEMHVADALSRNPIAIENKDLKDIEYLVEEIEVYLMMIETCFPATAGKLEEIRQRIMSDPTLQLVIHFTLHGWPNQSRSIGPSLKTYHIERAYLTYTDGLLLFCDRLVIPAAMKDTGALRSAEKEPHKPCGGHICQATSAAKCRNVPNASQNKSNKLNNR